MWVNTGNGVTLVAFGALLEVPEVGHVMTKRLLVSQFNRTHRQHKMKFSNLVTAVSGALSAPAFTVRVGLEVICKGIMAELSTDDKNFVAHTLEDTYNSLHPQFDDGDSVLSDVVFAQVIPGGLGFYAHWGCTVCSRDDPDFGEHWEDGFVYSLRNDAAFANVTRCSVTLFPLQ